jgi:hypothetical protein
VKPRGKKEGNAHAPCVYLNLATNLELGMSHVEKIGKSHRDLQREIL